MTDLSEIQEFYRGATIFLTGATGFLGKLVLEKILRRCPCICHVYILVRMKKGKTPGQRLMELFECPIFDWLKRNYPTFAQKITIINGDLSQPDFGIGEQDKKILIEDVDVIIHCAAAVRFDQSLSEATKINVRGTRDLMRVAKEMHHLKAFVYVSTAFSNCDREIIDEVIYPPKIDAHNLIQAVDALDDGLLHEMQSKLLGDLPNTYTLTKQVTEDLLRQDGQTLPLVIVRPSIVVATSEEPIAGYVDNYYGPTGLVVGIGVGFLRTILCNEDYKADLVPADLTVSHIIASAWYIGNKRVTREPKDPEVLNFVSSVQKPLKWGELARYIRQYGPEVAPVATRWYPTCIIQTSRCLHSVLTFLLHSVPAHISDFMAVWQGQMPMYVKAYDRLTKAADVISYFPTHQWVFSDTKTRDMLDQMSIQDRNLFNFDIKMIDWADYMLTYLKGARVYILNDPLETIDEGKKKLGKLKFIHYAVCSVLVIFFLFLIKIFFCLL